MELETADVKHIMEIETSQIMPNYDMTTSDLPSTRIKSLKRKNKKSSIKRQRSYYCPFCDRVDKHKNNMRQHIRSHTDERPYKCSCCEKAYRKSSALKEHQRRVHLGEPVQKGKQPEVLKFKCEICPKAFSAKGSFDRHLRSHFNEYVFKCNICDKTFRHDSTFNRHKKYSHQSVGQTNKCNICNKTLKGCKSDLKKHIKTHLKENKNRRRLKKELANMQEDHNDTVTVKEECDTDNDLQTNKIECIVDTEHTKSRKADKQQDSAAKTAMKVTFKAVLDFSNECKNVADTLSTVKDSEYSSPEEDESVSYDSWDSNDFNSDTEDEAAMCIDA
ncbi:zinc finger protein 888-like isoform X2 [Dreissena polymorpha]|uniref:C2H2-type domain-containing protein n=1 Tax=Dreissena polymorpha TaxID=45954 RepID=A0A9D4E6B4_DREPO|nr:zinc finger protein 888-like isoform X1 [Dreissena polymorpha]XP_052231970.1 zinc finger protein 888-like isoform X2 [Dreissena polymorpha]XP_052231972.1 zinc finger protein 888-like isoform X1 [Dreissena polymorpha]XP_052231973.1 zinc finger protein 888-like isoform X1 [Dreissena polymorpha]XP_052231974.1 zinc finger protein 888-like isoform X2 [Dreissena polymorpha]XP_052231975.1 zinc finger protein 888-like isoform X2 [Dreissena polymorpha]XP_052231976.1 zinc finger protein 888-like iso